MKAFIELLDFYQFSSLDFWGKIFNSIFVYLTKIFGINTVFYQKCFLEFSVVYKHIQAYTAIEQKSYMFF